MTKTIIIIILFYLRVSLSAFPLVCGPPKATKIDRWRPAHLYFFLHYLILNFSTILIGIHCAVHSSGQNNITNDPVKIASADNPRYSSSSQDSSELRSSEDFIFHKWRRWSCGTGTKGITVHTNHQNPRIRQIKRIGGRRQSSKISLENEMRSARPIFFFSRIAREIIRRVAAQILNN